jgi:hypothetical protein
MPVVMLAHAGSLNADGMMFFMPLGIYESSRAQEKMKTNGRKVSRNRHIPRRSILWLQAAVPVGQRLDFTDRI